MEHKFTPFFVKRGKLDWIVAEKSALLEDVISFFQDLRDKDSNGMPVVNKNKWVNSQIKISNKPPNNLFETVAIPDGAKEVKAKDHMPDREIPPKIAGVNFSNSLDALKEIKVKKEVSDDTPF
tara:strand:- start:2989 stop:3357 length:369 start_codon:yes stop_codon:yes gene_type:complete